MTMQLEDRLWERLEAAAEREASRGRPGRASAAARGALPARRLRAAAALVAAAALAALAIALVPERDAARWRVERFAVAGDRLSAGVSADGALWGYDARSGAVLRIDPASRHVLARLPIAAPDEDVALTSGAGALWAVAAAAIQHSSPAPAHPRPVRLLRIDPATNRVAARIVLRAPGGATLRPVDLVALPGAVWVWGEGGAMRVDPGRGRVTASIHLPGAKVMGFAATGARVTVTTDLGEMVAFDARSGDRLGATPFVGPVGRADLAAVGTDVVGYRRGGTLASTDAVTGRDRWAVRVGSRPRDLALTGGRLWVLLGGAAGDELRAFDPGSGRVLVRYALPADDARTLAPGGATPTVITHDGDVISVRVSR